MFSKCIIVHLWFLHMHVVASSLHCTVQNPPFYFRCSTVPLGVFHFRNGFTNQIWNSTGMFPACNTKRSQSVITETTDSAYYWAVQSPLLSVCLSCLSLDISDIFRCTYVPPRILHPSPYIFLSLHQSVAALIPMISLNILLRAEKIHFLKGAQIDIYKYWW